MNEQNWTAVAASLMNDLQQGESLTLSLSAEDSLFVRVTQAASPRHGRGLAGLDVAAGRASL